jgi:hypothetical protein
MRKGGDLGSLGGQRLALAVAADLGADLLVARDGVGDAFALALELGRLDGERLGQGDKLRIGR